MFDNSPCAMKYSTTDIRHSLSDILDGYCMCYLEVLINTPTCRLHSPLFYITVLLSSKPVIKIPCYNFESYLNIYYELVFHWPIIWCLGIVVLVG